MNYMSRQYWEFNCHKKRVPTCALSKLAAVHITVMYISFTMMVNVSLIKKRKEDGNFFVTTMNNF